MKFRACLRSALLVTGMLSLAHGCASSSSTDTPKMDGKSFPSAEVAAESLVNALRANDMVQLHAILGPDGDDILFSGDAVADRADAERFIAFYDEERYIRPEVGGVYTLIVGHDGWPFPVPIVQTDDAFVFDTATGREEVLNRRIGRNELAAEQVCLAIVDAQREYVELRPMGDVLPEYARKLLSDPGKKNGLYWPTADGEKPSPMGPLVAAAAAQGYGAAKKDASAASSDKPLPPPYHGYRYRLLTSQGAHANGGSINYLIDDKLVGGFGVVAYPADYGNSGIMTFITNYDGVVFQRDFGDDTEKVASTMSEFDPGPGWVRSTDETKPVQP